MKDFRRHLKQKFIQIFRTITSGNLQQRLGYDKNAKLLIIHADDLGLSASENAASIEILEKGTVNSGSIMVPCSGFQEISEYAQIHPEADLGVHLTLTNEWDKYTWGPVLPTHEVKSLVNEVGFFYKRTEDLSKHANPSEAELEFRAQIELAMKSGIDITHLDSHMFAAFSNKKIFEAYVKLGKQYRLPLLLTYELPIRYLIPRNAIIVDQLFCAKPEDNAAGLSNFYTNILKSIQPGLNCLLVHVAYDNKEMQDITFDHEDFGSAWRQADFDFFMSESSRQLIWENNIQLITWRELRDKLFR
jgi:chitin disaccharide deacetylase